MDSKDVPMLRWSTAALVLSGYWALAAVPQIGPAVILLPFVVILISPFAEFLHKTYPLYGTITRAITIGYLCFIPLSVISLDVLSAVTLLVAYIQCYSLLHKKESSNYYHLHLMSLFLLLAACVQNPEPVIGVVFLTFLVSGVWASLALRMAAERYRAKSLSTPEIVALENLSLDAFHGVADRDRTRMPLTATALSVAALAITIVFFLLTPRIEAGMFGRGRQVIETTGLSERVDLTTGTTLQEDSTPVMIVRFPDEPEGKVPDENWLYWRVTTLGVYKDNSWNTRASDLIDPGIAHAGSHFSETRESAMRYNGLVHRTRRPERRLIRQEIFLDSLPPRGIPAMFLAQKVQVTDGNKGKRLHWSRDGDATVLLDKTGSISHLNYTSWSEPGGPSPEALRAAPNFDTNEDSKQHAHLLSHNLSERTLALTNEVVGDATNSYDKAMAIQSFLSGTNFVYSLSIPNMPGSSVIETFLHSTRRGHCELFATAMALMLRTQGVPTRVVSGYRGGEWRDTDETYTVRANMAHLWVEAWFEGQGWVVFDPSPRPDYVPPNVMKQFSLFISRTVLKSKMFWFQEVLGFDRTVQFERLKNLSLGFVQTFTGASEPEETPRGGTPPSRMPLQLLLLVLLGVGGSILFQLRRRPKVEKHPLTREQMQVVRLYIALRRKLKKHGVDCTGKTAEELREVLDEPRWGAPGAACDILACYNAVRFGSSPLQGDQLAELKQGLRTLRPLDE